MYEGGGAGSLKHHFAIAKEQTSFRFKVVPQVPTLTVGQPGVMAKDVQL